jgi:alpha-tubulin suppressor-like RCC1 family protein
VDEKRPHRIEKYQAKHSTRQRWASPTRRAWVLIATMALLATTIAVVWTSVSAALNVPTISARALATFDAGGDQNIAIGSDNKLRSWGDNENGGLGDGSTEDRHEPQALVSAHEWLTVSAGERHTLAIATDGSLWAWGWNSWGQVQDKPSGPSDATKKTPVQLEAGYKWKAVSAGYGHSLAIREDGSLWAWGYNNGGQVGNGTNGDVYTPTRVNYDTDWVAISAGGFHSLALKADGSLWAWGLNDDGQVGDGDIVDRWSPVRIGTDNNWVSIAGGEFHSLAIKADGSMWAWGRNQRGQLGDGTNTSQSAPELIGAAPNWVAVAAGGSGSEEGDGHSMALMADGSLWTWGDNQRGQLGDGTTVTRNTMNQVGTKTNWVAISAGGQHCLALTSTGEIWAWGYNADGQVGDNTVADRKTPVQVLATVKIPTVTTTTTSTTTTSTTGSTTTSSTTSTSSTTTSTTVAEPVFTDVPESHPYHDAIVGLGARAIVGGYSDHTFRPDQPVLRKQFAKMIVGTMGLPVTEDDWKDATRPFTDCGLDDPNSLYPHDYIAVAKAHGLTEGKTPSTFAPNTQITRAQMVTMVVRAAKASEVPLKVVGADYDGTFKKYNDATHGANVKLAEYNGLLQDLQVTGSPAAWIMATATRGEIAQILWNLLQLSEE